MNHAGSASTRALLTAGLLAVGLSLNVADRVPAQEAGEPVPHAGTQVFRRYVLHNLFQLTPLKRVEDLAGDPGNSLLIVFGDTASLPATGLTPERLADFREQGMTLLIATDRPDHDWLKPWGMRIPGDLVEQDANHAYRHYVGCPRITSYRDPGSAHPLFQGLTRGLATNQPSYLLLKAGALQALATFSGDCWLLSRPGNFFGCYIAGTDSDSRPDQRMAVIAGHGIFMNAMMAQRDNDNFAFACNCIHWLTDGGKRKRVLLLEEGTVQSQFDIPIRETPGLHLPTSRVVNKILHNLEEERLFDRLLFKFIPPEAIKRMALILCTVGLLIYGVRRLLRAQHRAEPRALAAATGQQATAEIELPVMNQRYRDVVRAGNFWEAARTLARSCFDQAADGWHGSTASSAPLVVADGWLRRWMLARRVSGLWRLAHGPAVTVTPRAFARIARQVQAVQGALANGTLRFDARARRNAVS
jgi:hypothetical protein